MGSQVTLRPKCADCGRRSDLVGGREIYPHRPDLFKLSFYLCPACPNSYIGCHLGTDSAIGKPGGPETRQAREAAREAFDPLWKAKATRDKIRPGKAREDGQKWLAPQLGLRPDDCQINLMDADTALRVVEICRAVRTKLSAPTLPEAGANADEDSGVDEERVMTSNTAPVIKPPPRG
jgi:hypothetical protein